MAFSSKARFPHLVLAVLVGGALLFAGPPGAAQQPDPIAIEDEASAAFVPGEVIVRFRAGTSAETRDQVLALVGASVMRPLGLTDTVLAGVPVGTEIKAAESLGVDPNVVYAEPNGIVHTNVTTE